MARPLRIEFGGALYHVTSCGNAHEDIYQDDSDRAVFLDLLNRACDRHHWLCHAYCLTSNHYHLLIETNAATLSKGMQYLNGTYTQQYNRRHQRAGHVFQGRFKAIIVEKDTYLMELARYIVLNPVRTKMVRAAKDWRWSSYRATAGLSKPHDCLTTDWILSDFGSNRAKAIQRYRAFVQGGKNQLSPWGNLKNQVYLGSGQFVDDMLCKLNAEQSSKDIPKPLAYYEERYESRNEAMAQAYLSGHFTLSEVGEHFGVSYATVSRVVKAWESNVQCNA